MKIAKAGFLFLSMACSSLVLAQASLAKSCDAYTTVVWQMPSWVEGEATFPQQFYAQVATASPDLNALDSLIAASCGTQYQIDVYYCGQATDRLITSGVLPDAGADLDITIPGDTGTAYKVFKAPDCQRK